MNKHKRRNWFGQLLDKMSYFFHSLRCSECGHLEVQAGPPQDGYKRTIQVKTHKHVCNVWFNLKCCGHSPCGQEASCYVSNVEIIPDGFQFTVVVNCHSCKIKWVAVC